MGRWELVRVVAGLGVAAALVVWHPQLKGESDDPYWTLTGKTEQGHAIRLHLDDHGRFVTFETRIDGTWLLSGRLSHGEWRGTMHFTSRYATPDEAAYDCLSPIVTRTA